MPANWPRAWFWGLGMPFVGVGFFVVLSIVVLLFGLLALLTLLSIAWTLLLGPLGL